jgi:hypothetical protein
MLSFLNQKKGGELVSRFFGCGGGAWESAAVVLF